LNHQGPDQSSELTKNPENYQQRDCKRDQKQDA
jgi:hypothetical protein